MTPLVGRLTILAATAGIPSGSHAADWAFVNGNNDVAQFMDRDSARVSGSMVEIWVMDIYRRPQSGGVARELTLTAYDCNERTAGPIEIWKYDSSGQVIDTVSFPSRRWVRVPPSTTLERAWTAACIDASDLGSFSDPAAAAADWFNWNRSRRPNPR